MSRFDFMRELEGLLEDIPLEERNEALKYYNDYFDDAGVDNEDKTISELGTPERIASIIKADLKAEGSSYQDRGIFTEKGYKDTLYEEKKFEVINPAVKDEKDDKQFNSHDSFNNSYRNTNNTNNTNKTNNTNIALIIIICIFAIPIGIPVIATVFGIVLSIVLALFGVFFGFAIAGVVMVPVGIAMIFIGLVKMAVPFWGLSIMGGGLLVLGLGILFLMLSIWIFKMVFPAMIKGIVYICRLPFKNRSVSV